MLFLSKLEAYSYAILVLMRFKEQFPIHASLASKSIAKMQIAFENHEPNPLRVVEYLDDVLRELFKTSFEHKWLTQVRDAIVKSDYQQNPEQKFANPLGRRFESEVGITLLTDPTIAMMQAVGRVSKQLLVFINDIGKGLDKNYLDDFGDESQAITFGICKNPTIKTISCLLDNNHPTTLAEILYIHFKFAQIITRRHPILHAPCRKPVGQLAKIVEQIWNGSPETFFSEAIAQEHFGHVYREYIPNKLMYGSSLYTVFKNRGRSGMLKTHRTKQMGLMLLSQTEFMIDLPTHSSDWIADCQNQAADFDSPHVSDLINNDTVYVSGPSGMTGLLLGQMELLTNFESEDLKKNYLTAVMAYLVAAGFHSIHEVLGPAQYLLNLIPGYHIEVPSDQYLAQPPNFNQYFSQQKAIDPEFQSRHEDIWSKYLQFFAMYYVPVNLELDMPSSILNLLRTDVCEYILSRGSENGKLNIISNAFRNSILTQKKINIARNLNEELVKCRTVQEVETLLFYAQIENTQAEIEVNKTYSFVTGSVLNRILERYLNAINHLTSSKEDYVLSNVNK